jgi:hypothetical protein
LDILGLLAIMLPLLLRREERHAFRWDFHDLHRP